MYKNIIYNVTHLNLNIKQNGIIQERRDIREFHADVLCYFRAIEKSLLRARG